MAKLIDGKLISAQIRAELKERLAYFIDVFMNKHRK